MPARVHALSLPLFDESDRLDAVLDAPGVTAGGAIVSTDGHRGYWAHSVDELEAARSNEPGHVTLGDLRPRGRKLTPVGGAKAEGFRLTKPSAGEAGKVLSGIFSGLEAPGLLLSAFGRSALVYSRLGSAFIVIGKTYHCSKDSNEVYDQDDFDANNGECPVHEGARLILNK